MGQPGHTIPLSWLPAAWTYNIPLSWTASAWTYNTVIMGQPGHIAIPLWWDILDNIPYHCNGAALTYSFIIMAILADNIVQ
jgi:hypothetical protein